MTRMPVYPASAQQPEKGVGLSGPTPAFGEPPLAETAPLILGESAPHPCFLIGLKGVLETFLLNGTLRTNSLGGRDVIEGRPGGSYGKE